ncbi:RHS repeat-associated core domain-containing protein [Flavobacterium sp. LC2016-23]|uniref:RHS repeat-associated core domain-containing protein n=1 Tax=Flavobacterium sp. LC2016-23 TaxID=2666330 RepID=UPI001E5D50D4
MNGRIYDPNLHRFLQPDNNIQDPFNTQNYNRYGYVLNNPLKYTDPTGEFWNVVGYFLSGYIMGAYASGGELNPAKWNSSAFITIGAAGASAGASAVATNLTNNYLDNYNKPPELGISAVNVLNFFPKINDSFENGLNQRVVDVYDFFDHEVSSSSYWANTITNFGNDVKNGRSLFFNASEAYHHELFNNAVNMSVYDWAYAAGYSAPDMAVSFAVPYAAEGIVSKIGNVGIIEEIAITRTYTKSSLSLGREMHAAYKANLADNITTFKEFTGIKGIRPDFVDFSTRTIYELKPYNPNQIKVGTRQLFNYKVHFEKNYGGVWNTVLDHY